MKFKKIVGFGDSWMWGDELLDPSLIDHQYAHPVIHENTDYREKHCFLGLLGKHYEVPTENFGIPGGSLQSTIWTYLWWLEHENLSLNDCLVVVSLTQPNRHSFYNPNHRASFNDKPWNRFIHSAWVHSGANIDPEWKDMVKRHTVLTDCEESQDLNYKQTVLFFDGQQKNTAGVVQFNSTIGKKYSGIGSLIWPGSGLADMLYQSEQQSTLLAPQGHPNTQGHEWIASRLIPEVDRVTISR